MATPETVVFSLIGLAVGLVMAKRAYTISRWGEILDAIGRKSAGRVEPADWNVWLTRAAGVLIAAISAVFLVVSLLE